jgi:hypothetical protein
MEKIGVITDNKKKCQFEILDKEKNLKVFPYDPKRILNQQVFPRIEMEPLHLILESAGKWIFIFSYGGSLSALQLGWEKPPQHLIDLLIKEIKE